MRNSILLLLFSAVGALGAVGLVYAFVWNKKYRYKLSRRPIEAGDNEFARQIHHAAYLDVVTRQFGGWNVVEQDVFFEKGWTATPHEILLIDGVPCGYISLEEAPEHITLHELVVSPDFQNRGIGSRVLKQITAYAKKHKIPARLQVLKQNRAIGLYSRWGFRSTGQNEKHVFMEYNPK